MVQVVQVILAVHVVRIIILDEMHSENICFTWYEKGKWKQVI